MGPYPKHIKKQLRHLADILYERELNEALSRLDTYFAEWREQKISPFLLSKKIHEFHQGEARDLYGIYVINYFLDDLVAKGIVLGKLKNTEIPPGVWEVVEQLVKKYEAQLEGEQ